ncbi:hypothetical protein STRIP9103_06131 [Streptomyces ipomoeae 91-03]|uniref:Uncharacterized protein n=1 Tax=Streptomyces ipomoeae 91-03 TaxID=698759 RepID=L1KST2_9ACTN|nr:hypothetical protein STRIP9103_06131 [Streptomyces ipomoeae 91-03]
MVRLICACARARACTRARVRGCPRTRFLVRARLLRRARWGHGVLRAGGRPLGAGTRAGARLPCRVLVIRHASIVTAEPVRWQSG